MIVWSAIVAFWGKLVWEVFEFTGLLFAIGYVPRYLLSLSRLPTSWPRATSAINNASLFTMSIAGALAGLSGILFCKSIADGGRALQWRRQRIKEIALVEKQDHAVKCVEGLRKLIEDKYPYTLELDSGNFSPNEHRKVSLGDTMSAETACKVLEKLRPVYNAFELKDTNIGKSIATTLSVLRCSNIKNI